MGLKPVYNLALKITGSTGLNRTSVGLKHSSQAVQGVVCLEPQSNQRGIETGDADFNSDPNSEPQSNQRGIETGPNERLSPDNAPGLNRTSVGLKPAAAMKGSRPRPVSLNRTSVGLKQHSR